MKRANLQRQVERGVQMHVVTDENLKKEEIKIDSEGASNIYSIIKDLHYSINEV
jgi:hypothetical protein